MALTSATKLQRRAGSEFGYPVAAGEKIFRGGLTCVNSAGSLVRPQTAGAVAFVGVAERDYDNSASAAVSADKVATLRGVFAITVPAATAANINANVYLTDDNTVTLTNSGSLIACGTLIGIEASQTFLRTTGA